MGRVGWLWRLRRCGGVVSGGLNPTKLHSHFSWSQSFWRPTAARGPRRNYYYKIGCRVGMAGRWGRWALGGYSNTPELKISCLFYGLVQPVVKATATTRRRVRAARTGGRSACRWTDSRKPTNPSLGYYTACGCTRNCRTWLRSGSLRMADWTANGKAFRSYQGSGARCDWSMDLPQLRTMKYGRRPRATERTFTVLASARSTSSGRGCPEFRERRRKST